LVGGDSPLGNEGSDDDGFKECEDFRYAEPEETKPSSVDGTEDLRPLLRRVLRREDVDRNTFVRCRNKVGENAYKTAVMTLSVNPMNPKRRLTLLTMKPRAGLASGDNVSFMKVGDMGDSGDM